MVFEPIKLTAEQKKSLLDLAADIKLLKIEIDRAKRAGLDVAELEADYNKAVKLRDGILKEYG